jgi:hypothetical protein
VSTALGELGEEFQTETGRRPWARELSELLTLELQSLREDVIPGLARGATVVVHTTPEAKEPHDGSRVSELNDAVFIATNDLIVASAEQHNPVSTASVSASLTQALRDASDDILGDDPPVAIDRIEIVARAGAKSPQVGDIVSIPAPDGKFFLALIVAKNSLGIAYGLFEGTHPPQPVSADAHPAARPRPVYEGDEAIASGRWKVIGHEPGLLQLFPGEPEIYHYSDPETGRPALGETAAGEIRELSEDEAREIGLEDESYRQFLLPDQLERYLSERS